MVKKYEKYSMERVQTPEGRRYKIPGTDEFYESVTTAIGKASKSKKAFFEWRKRVGEEEANRVSRVASKRGTKVHKIIEDYLNGKQDYLEGHMPPHIQLFKSVQGYLDTNIASVYMQDSLA